ncbi:hypothetical protein Leryth_019724 [Lithospermum erythrorhizon]|nr:hypothetical protein Leryth_019724 [Lithospermum erythrorhizon]
MMEVSKYVLEWWEESNQRSRAAVVQGRTAAPPARVAPFARRQPAAPERAHVVMGTKAAPTINSIVPSFEWGLPGPQAYYKG